MRVQVLSSAYAAAFRRGDDAISIHFPVFAIRPAQSPDEER
jgi:hypothetical protein